MAFIPFACNKSTTVCICRQKQNFIVLKRR